MDHPEDVNVSVTYLEKNLVGRPATTDTEKQLSDLEMETLNAGLILQS